LPDDDRIIALWAERCRIAAQLVALDPADSAGAATARPLVDELVSIDDRIAARCLPQRSVRLYCCGSFVSMSGPIR
jgi:hypothetical protein